MQQLRVSLLGPPSITIDGAPLLVDTRKATALLAYLATSAGPLRRDSVAALLWPDYDHASARGALRRTLSTLKKGLGGLWLQVDRATIGLTDGGIWKDVAEFRRLLAGCEGHGHAPSEVCPSCATPLRAAAMLYRGDFMAGFSLRDSVEFEDWQLLQAEHFRRSATSALERHHRCLIARGDLAAAIDQAHRWLSLEPLHEPAHRQLMLLYAWSDQRAAAIKQYRDCVAILDRELGVAPLDETSELYRAVMENRTPPPESFVVQPSVSKKGKSAEPVRRQYPLVGRAEEWTALVDAYERVTPDGHVVVVRGEAGIGKSRLCDDFLEQVRARAAVGIATRCHEGETDLTYGPVIDLLRGALHLRMDKAWMKDLADQALMETARLVPELDAGARLASPPNLGEPGAKSRFYEGLVQFLSAACSGPPSGVLFVDDVQWLDDASADFLAFLAMRLARRPLLLLLATRARDIQGGGQLLRLLPKLQNASLLTSISLDRLGQDEVEELARHARPDMAVDRAVTDRLYRETDGLPIFLVEYLRALHSGAAVPAPIEPPSGVRDLLRARVAGVAQTARQVLSTAAVIGGSFDFDVLWRSAGRSEDEAVSAVEELVALDLLQEQTADGSAHAASYDFRHSLIREFVYQETNAARRRLLHGRVGDALSRFAPKTDGIAPMIAHHYELGGRPEDAARFYELAGEHARSFYAYGDALAHFNHALALGHPDPARLHEATGDLRTLLGEYKPAVTSYETAAASAGVDALVNLEHKLGNVHDRLGDWDAAQSHFDAALSALGEELDPRTPRILADESLTLHHRRHGHRAYEVAERSLELAGLVGDAQSLAQAHNILGILSSRSDKLEEGRRHLEESLRLAASLSDESARAAALNNLALTVGAEGNYTEAIDLAQSALELCKKQRDRHREAALNNNLADLLHAAGHHEESMKHLRAAVTIFAEIGAEAGELEPQIWKLVEW